jgi:hypothetical protein
MLPIDVLYVVGCTWLGMLLYVQFHAIRLAMDVGINEKWKDTSYRKIVCTLNV